MTFGARLRLLRNKRYEDWWHIVFGGPLGVLVAAVIADVRWITPNLITLVAFVLRLVGTGLLLVREPWADLAALVLLQVTLVLDITDGSLARYRKQATAFGAFLDKTTDAASITALGFVLGYRAWLDGGGVLHLLAGAFIATSFLLRRYMYWLVVYLEKERDASATEAPRGARFFGDLSFRERLHHYLSRSWRIILVSEGDIYFWVAVALVLGRVPEAVLALAAATAFWLVALGGKRVAAVVRLDRPRP